MFSSYVSDEGNVDTLHSGHISSAQYFSKICLTDDNLVGGDGDLAPPVNNRSPVEVVSSAVAACSSDLWMDGAAPELDQVAGASASTNTRDTTGSLLN